MKKRVIAALILAAIGIGVLASQTDVYNGLNKGVAVGPCYIEVYPAFATGCDAS